MTETTEILLRNAILSAAKYSNDGYFTTDDVWRKLDLQLREPRVLGPVMQDMASEGKIQKTYHFQPSSRPECHRRPVRVWERA